MSRYNKRTVATNSNEQYKNLLEKRGVEKVKQYKTLEKEVLEQEVYDSVETFDYAWTYGDMVLEAIISFLWRSSILVGHCLF